MELNRESVVAIFLMLVLLGALPCEVKSLSDNYYEKKCPNALSIIRQGVEKAINKEKRLGASLLRLHFHDCFVQGCDASILLDDTSNFTGEKTANPNANSVRGFMVVDGIKASLEKSCPGIVSCADIISVAARDSVAILGGPCWNVQLGRKDSKGASLSLANSDIPAPTSTFQTLVSKFSKQGLDITDLVALSGAHTIGLARCTSFKKRLYNQTGNGQPDSTLDKTYLLELRKYCPQTGKDDNQTLPLDPTTPTHFDNHYYSNLVASKGLLNSDQVLLSSGGNSAALVNVYASASGSDAFFRQFSESMIKMGRINVLTGSHGEIRKNCRRINS